jgi:hypothetical protein
VFLASRLLFFALGLRFHLDRGEYRRAQLLGFWLVQIGFVVAASSLFSSVESARYRYTVEPFIWAVVPLGVRAAAVHFGPRLRQLVQKRPSKDKLGIVTGPITSSSQPSLSQLRLSVSLLNVVFSTSSATAQKAPASPNGQRFSMRTSRR